MPSPTAHRLFAVSPVAAVSVSAAATGAIAHVSTTVLMTAAEGMAAMEKAEQLGYQPPS